MSGSLNGDLLLSSGLTSSTSVSDLPLPQKPLVRASLSVAPADYPERPEVMLRRDTLSSTLPLKTDVPLHLFSTTNQQHKLVGVQQQIPTKLAAFSSGKGKTSRSGKASHRTDSTGKEVEVIIWCRHVSVVTETVLMVYICESSCDTQIPHVQPESYNKKVPSM